MTCKSNRSYFKPRDKINSPKEVPERGCGTPVGCGVGETDLGSHLSHPLNHTVRSSRRRVDGDFFRGKVPLSRAKQGRFRRKTRTIYEVKVEEGPEIDS